MNQVDHDDGNKGSIRNVGVSVDDDASYHPSV